MISSSSSIVVCFHRKTSTHITVKNPSGNQKGVKQITVDGTPISGTIVPCSEGKHEVVVEM